MSENVSSFGLEGIISDEDLMDFIVEYIQQDESELRELILAQCQLPNYRTVIPRCVNYASTTWGLLLSNPLTANPLSYYGKNFVEDFAALLISLQMY